MKNIQDITINMLTESFKGNEDLIEQFKERAPKFYNVCLQIEKLNEAIEFKPNYSIDSNENGTFEINFNAPLRESSTFTGYLNSKGVCKIKCTHFMLDNTTVEFLNGLNNILKNFKKFSY